MKSSRVCGGGLRGRCDFGESQILNRASTERWFREEFEDRAFSDGGPCGLEGTGVRSQGGWDLGTE